MWESWLKEVSLACYLQTTGSVGTNTGRIEPDWTTGNWRVTAASEDHLTIADTPLEM